MHIFMVDHRSTSLPEYGPTDYLAPEPCFPNYFDYIEINKIYNILPPL